MNRVKWTLENEGECAVNNEASTSTASEFLEPLKTYKKNISTEAEPKMVVIGEYWEQEKVTQVVDLLKEYNDLFPRNFSELKGILPLG